MPAQRTTLFSAKRFVAALTLAALLGGSVARAEPPPTAPPAEAKAPAPIAPATDAEAEAALATYKEEFKARGLTGDDRLAQRDFAMSRLAKVQHAKVVDALGAVSRAGDPILRTLAVIYLGEQRAHTGLAGAHVAAAAKRGDDRVLLMSALQAIGRLRYLGARDVLKSALQHQDYAVKKVAILSVGETGDLRLLEDVARVVGLDIGKEVAKAGEAAAPGSSGKEEKTEGYSWDGVDVTYDTGTAGDGDQKMAEAIGKAQMAANEAAARAGASGSGGGGSGVDGSTGGGLGGGAARSPQELLPNVLLTLHRLTGQKFKSPHGVVLWTLKHKEEVAARLAKLEADEKAQRAAAKK
jgi:hypothetical protein